MEIFIVRNPSEKSFPDRKISCFSSWKTRIFLFFERIIIIIIITRTSYSSLVSGDPLEKGYFPRSFCLAEEGKFEIYKSQERKNLWHALQTSGFVVTLLSLHLTCSLYFSFWKTRGRIIKLKKINMHENN